MRDGLPLPVPWPVSYTHLTSDGAWLDSATLTKYAEDGTIEGYYKIQQENFLKNGKITEEEGAVPVTDFVLFDIMTEAGK